jgi:hypothetical protein
VTIGMVEPAEIIPQVNRSCDMQMRNCGGSYGNVKYRYTPKNVTLAANVTTATPKELRERRDVRGASGWQVNGNGEAFKHRRRKRADGNMPVIDLGDSYVGPLPPAYGQHHGQVFLDEVVALAFYGLPQVETLTWYPRAGYALRNGMVDGMHVRHLDGDPANCRFDNLAWVPDAEYFEATDAKLLRPNNITPRTKGRGLFPWANHRYDEPRFTSSASVAGWTPTRSARIKEPATLTNSIPTNQKAS